MDLLIITGTIFFPEAKDTSFYFDFFNNECNVTDI